MTISANPWGPKNRGSFFLGQNFRFCWRLRVKKTMTHFFCDKNFRDWLGLRQKFSVLLAAAREKTMTHFFCSQNFRDWRRAREPRARFFSGAPFMAAPLWELTFWELPFVGLTIARLEVTI